MFMFKNPYHNPYRQSVLNACHSCRAAQPCQPVLEEVGILRIHRILITWDFAAPGW